MACLLFSPPFLPFPPTTSLLLPDLSPISHDTETANTRDREGGVWGEKEGGIECWMMREIAVGSEWMCPGV